MDKLKVLVADDTVIIRKLISDIVDGTDMGYVVHAVPNGSIAVEWLKQEEIDVVMLDAHLAGENSLDILDKIKEASPYTEVIMISDDEYENVSATISALERGALDFIYKPGKEIPGSGPNELKNQLQMLFTQIKVKRYSSPSKVSTRDKCLSAAEQKPADDGVTFIAAHSGKTKQVLQSKPYLVLIASSTGGPIALETVLSGLPQDFPCPVFVVQHMPPEFTGIMAQTLNKKCQLKVTEGYEGEIAKAGEVIIAPGGRHMAIERRRDEEISIHLDDSPFVNGVRPAADVLFSSAAGISEGRDVLAVILTGMGNDGVQGVAELKRKGRCHCIIQSERTCVVYGMPGSVYTAGLADEIADVEDISVRICQICKAWS